VMEFERIKAVELQETLGALAGGHVEFFRGNVEIWERFISEMEGGSGSVLDENPEV